MSTTTLTLTDIEQLTELYAMQRHNLNVAVSALQDGIAALQAAHLPTIRAAVANVADVHLRLSNAIAANPALFEKPRTQSWHGVKVGLQKGAGGIEYEDADDVVARIEKLLADEADTYIATKKKPIKASLLTLDVGTLKKLGCTVVETGDRVVIKASDTAVDKIVRALLKGAVDDADADADEEEGATA